jgi:ubiquinone/menaquinone biosynthesis C-methylase UbiE
MAGTNAIGMDFSLGMLQVTRRQSQHVPLALADLQATLPFPDRCFDAVLCALIGEHLNDLGLVYSEFYRVLCERGRLVFSVYHPEMSAAGIEANFERAGVEYRLGAIHYSLPDHLRLLREAGFGDIQVQEFNGDKELIKSVPAAAKYLDSPILLVLVARKI